MQSASYVIKEKASGCEYIPVHRSIGESNDGVAVFILGRRPWTSTNIQNPGKLFVLFFLRRSRNDKFDWLIVSPPLVRDRNANLKSTRKVEVIKKLKYLGRTKTFRYLIPFRQTRQILFRQTQSNFRCQVNSEIR